MKRTFYKYVQRVRLSGLALLSGLLAAAHFPAQAQQQLVWEENFNTTSINPNTWTFDVGDGCAQGVCGWGNSELETYTNRPENARVENGNLVIEARREAYQGRQFTSARLKTLGRVQFKYGTLEARIKVPNLQNGLWPAFWLLGASGTWPASGETDIMEMGSAAAIKDGVINRRVGGATHWQNAGQHASYDRYYDSPTDLTNDYHVYRMTWDSQLIRMFIDDHEYYAIDISKGAAADLEEFHKAQYILLNLAVGGQYTGIYGADGITAPLPGQMLVDYIRLYQSPGDELYLGTNNGIAGEFGIYTENPAITQRLAYGQDANLFIWNNLANITSPTPVPFEGQEVLALRANPGAWFGMGVDNQVKNLVAFDKGSLKLQFKTSYTGQFKFGIKSGAGESWVDFPAGTSRFGLVRDGQWHEVVIPMSAFNNGDLGSLTATFMFAGDAPGSAADFYFDNIYYSGGVATNPAPTVSLTSPTNEALITTPATITLTANAADANGSVTKVEFYSGTTLLGTSTAAPYSATWSNVLPGTYTLTAKATDNEGVTTTSAPIIVFVAAPNNTAPTVAITAPTASTSFTTPATITIAANAADADGSVYKVEFYNGQTLLGTDYSSPYTYNWSGVQAGTYTLTAKVTDNGKLVTTSAPVTITVKSNTIAGPNFGVYTENAQVTDKLVYGQDADLYLWNNLSNIPSPTPYEGADVLALRAGAGNWFGFGVANSVKNLAAFSNGSLKFHFKTTYAGQFKVGVKSGTEGWVDFAPGATQYGLVRDGQWHEVVIPLKAFGNLDWTALEQAFMFAGDAPSATADFYFDNIYYNSAPVTLPPVTYCATAASGDYSYTATTVGTNVNFVFHPLGATAGGNLAIIYVNGPGYSMTKNAQGDFTYSLPNQTAGQALNFYFTYQVGAGGGEKNSAATPHTYTVGSVCSDAPAPQAPTVSLTSPTASATFAAPATITLTANAADADGTISKVEFYQGTTLLGTATTAPYSFSWSNVAAGSYALTAKAFDNSGLATTSTAVAITVTGSTPGGDTGGYCGTATNSDFSWKAVTTGTDVAFTFHPLGATAGGNLVILYINGGGYGMTKNSAGDFTYTARGQAAGAVLSLYFTYQVGPNGFERNTADAKVSYTVGTSCAAAPANTPPTVSLTSPTASATFAAPASITLTASAADADGSIAKVEFYQGATLLGSATAAPYSFQWNNVAVGSYAIMAKATDNGGLATTSVPVNITVAYADEDGDGYPANEDCDDHNAAVHPGLVFYVDADGDGFGNSSAPTITACLTPAGYVLKGGDCNDQDATINPAAKDVCGQDRNCDGKLDLPAQAAPTIAVKPASTVYTGGSAQTIYLGYGSQSVTLTATATSAVSYSWSPATGLGATAGASTVFTPKAAGSYTLQVTAKNAAGCTATASVAIAVIDVRAGKKGDKVAICHNGNSLEISASDVAERLRKGATLGHCATSVSAVAESSAYLTGESASLRSDEVTLYPNPAQDHTRLEITLAQDGQYTVSIYDLKGTLVKHVSSGQGSRSQRLTFELNASEFADGIYLVRLVTSKEVQTKRLSIRH